MVKLTFGDIFIRKNGVNFRMVFLHESRNGDLTFGTENGGRIMLDIEQFSRDIEKGLIKHESVKRGGK